MNLLAVQCPQCGNTQRISLLNPADIISCSVCHSVIPVPTRNSELPPPPPVVPNQQSSPAAVQPRRFEQAHDWWSLSLSIFAVAASFVSLWMMWLNHRNEERSLRLQSFEDKRIADQISRLQADVEAAVRLSRMAHERASNGRRRLVLDPASQNYQSVDIDQGKLLVSLKGTEPYLDGVRLQLSIGNPLAIDFNGYDVVARWGKRFDDATHATDYGSWRETLKERTYSQKDILQSASWNESQLFLPGIDPTDLGYIELEIEVSTISLPRAISKP